ncbi:MAG: HEAT repeat domain-containing protein [Acidobacteriota bacterium]
MTEIIASSFLIGAAASYPLLRWARTKNSDLMKIEYHCTTKLLPLLPIGLVALMCALYSPAYAMVMTMLAGIVALLTATTVERVQNDGRGSFSSLTTDAGEAEINVNRIKKWISGLHAFVLVLLLSIVGAEIALWNSPGNGIALPFPKLYAFLGGKRATNVLLETIVRKDNQFPIEATVTLIEMGKTDDIVRLKAKAVPVLTALLHYRADLTMDLLYYSPPPRINDGTIRGEAAGMLARIGRPAMPALSSALHNDDSDVRALAAAALAEMRDQTVIRVLEDADRRIHFVNIGNESWCDICKSIRQLKSK